MILSKNEFKKLNQFDSKLIELADWQIINARLAQITEDFNTTSGYWNESNTPLPIGTIIAITSYNDEFDTMDAHIVLDSSVLRTTANYYNQLANMLDTIEKKTNQLPETAPISWTPDFSNLFKEDPDEEFHMKLDIPGTNAEEIQYTKVGM